MTSLKQWQSHLNAMYPNIGKSPDYMMTHLYTACSDIGRTLLRNEGAARRDAAVLSAISWMMALSNYFEVNYEDALVKRFPGCCPYCLGRPCECDVTERRAKQGGRILSAAETKEELSYKNTATRSNCQKIDFAWLIGQLRAIYPGNRILLAKGGAGYITGKLLEEGGELHRAYSDVLATGASKGRVSQELADLTAWIVSCWDVSGSGKSLDAEFASEYGRACPVCDQSPCACQDYSITPGQEELLSQITLGLKELREAEEVDVSAAIQLAEEASINPSADKKKSLVEYVGKIAGTLKSTDEGVGSAASIVVKIMNAANALKDMIN